MTDRHQRSRCPINLSLEVIGDSWSLLILRDMIFGGRRHFRELLTGSPEGIASNILSQRLKALVDRGLLTRHADPTHRQKVIYSLTEAGIQLVPVLAALGTWGSDWLQVSEELSIRARILGAGGPPLWQRFMAELRAEHIGAPAEPAEPSEPFEDGRTVRQRLRAAVDAIGAENAALSAQSARI